MSAWSGGALAWARAGVELTLTGGKSLEADGDVARVGIQGRSHPPSLEPHPRLSTKHARPSRMSSNRRKLLHKTSKLLATVMLVDWSALAEASHGQGKMSMEGSERMSGGA